MAEGKSNSSSAIYRAAYEAAIAMGDDIYKMSWFSGLRRRIQKKKAA